MSGDFRILNEHTINFKKDKIYVMLLKELGNFGVEVTSKEKGYGRKFAEDKAKATELFDAIATKLSKIKTFELAEKKLKSYFSIKDINEVLFLLNSEDVVRSQASIGDLNVNFKLKTKPHYDTKGDAHSEGSVTLDVYFGKKRKPIGRFIGTRFGEDFIFERL